MFMGMGYEIQHLKVKSGTHGKFYHGGIMLEENESKKKKKNWSLHH